MKAYKLFRLRQNGTLGSLFIGCRQQILLGQWLEAEDIPTKGYAHRPGWHSGVTPKADHLTEHGRVWCEVEVCDFYAFKRPKHQGGKWLISQWLKVNKILSVGELSKIRSKL